jgi:hypothetical protein
MSNTSMYTIKTTTSNKMLAGTDANVFIQLFGENGSSGMFLEHL